MTTPVRNTGPNAATGATVTDRLPEGLAFLSATADADETDPRPGNNTDAVTVCVERASSCCDPCGERPPRGRQDVSSGSLPQGPGVGVVRESPGHDDAGGP